MADPLQSAKAEGDLKSRVEKLERQFELITEGFEWAAAQIKPMFGQGALAMIFQGIADGLRSPKSSKKARFDGK